MRRNFVAFSYQQTNFFEQSILTERCRSSRHV